MDEQNNKECSTHGSESGQDEISFDAFDTGTIWTQEASTQVHRQRWTRGGQQYSEDMATAILGPEDGGEHRHDGTLSDASADQLSRPLTDPFDCTPPHGRPMSEDDRQECSPSRDPWWKKGKTAPLLDQYDQQRRLWYMIQAGVFDRTTSVHDAVATRECVTLDLTGEEPTQRIVEGRSFLQTPSRPTAAPTTTTAPASTTPIPPGPAMSAPPRAALSMAGNVNWPIASAGTPSTPVMQTPKRKTWGSTMAQRQLTNTDRSTPGSVSASAKKRKASRAGAATPKSGGKKRRAA